MENVHGRNGRADPWLRVIALFKLVKATLLVGGGIAALGLLKPHTAQAVTQWATELAADRHSQVLEMLITRLMDVDAQTLRLLSVGSLLYSALFYAEGFGLLSAQPWAEYLTIVTTAGLIPFELYELHLRITLIKMGVLVANVAIVLYLARRVTRDGGRGREPAHAGAKS